MQFATSLTMAAVALFGMATAQDAIGDAIIIVEDLRLGVNSTVPVPINPIFTGDAALSHVSTLYLVDSVAVPVDTITCTPYLNADGTGDRGNPFDFENPSRLDLNTVVVGSIVCTSTVE